MSKRKSLTPMLDYVGIRLAEESHVDVVRYRRELRRVKAALRVLAATSIWLRNDLAPRLAALGIAATADEARDRSETICRVLARLRRGTRATDEGGGR